MTLPLEFENELENWLNARLDERFARQQRALHTLVIKTVEAMLNEQIRRDGDLCKREFGEEFAKLDQGFAKLQRFVDQMQTLTEKMKGLERVMHDEPVDSVN